MNFCNLILVENGFFLKLVLGVIVVIRQLERPGHCDLPDLQAGTPYPKVTGPDV